MKEYIKPSMMVTLLNTQPLMTNSLTGTNLDGVTIGEGEYTGGHADSRRRRRNDWEDEWDDEEEDW